MNSGSLRISDVASAHTLRWLGTDIGDRMQLLAGYIVNKAVPYLFEHDPPRIAYKGADPGADYNPVGFYRRTVVVPWSPDECSVYLHVGAATSALWVWVNGVAVGYSQDSKLPAEFCPEVPVS